jgi:peptidoglycan hydrolase-like protein with peptidoglycan-binding domain
MNTRQTAGIALLGMVVAAGAGWVAGSRIQSPAEIAAQTAPPTASPILVAAEERVLSTNIVTRGTGRFGDPRELVLAPSLFKPEVRLATRVPQEGSELTEGDALMSVGGREVTLFRGSSPSYRDLGIGVSGTDVAQLEQGLRRLGYDPGPADGVFDSLTEQAVAAWYARRGVEPITASADDLEEILPIQLRADPSGAPTGGLIVPADELIFVEALPIRVTETLVGRGAEIDGPVALVSDATVAIDSSVPIEEAGLLRAGMRVLIDEPDLGISATGVVSRIAYGPGTDGVDGFHVYFEVLVDDPQPVLINASTRLTVPVETTGEPVLVVPITALTLGGDGTSRVQRARGEVLELLEVEPGLSAQGFVEVSPIGNDLGPGDLVLIGFESVTPNA